MMNFLVQKIILLYYSKIKISHSITENIIFKIFIKKYRN